MNLGQQTGALVSTVSIINSLDEATREKVLAELPEELKRRLVAEQHAASILAAARLNLNANSAQEILASGFFNLSPSEAVIGHTINSLKAPMVSGLAHGILKTSAAGASHNAGIITPAASHHCTATQYSTTWLLPRTGANTMVTNPAPVNGTNAHGFIGSHSPGLRISGTVVSQSVNARALGTGITLGFGSKGPGGSTSHSLNPRAGLAQNTSSMSTAWQRGAASPASLQMGPIPGNAIHLSNSHRSATLPASFSPGINGHLVRYKPIISTYLDDFKQGFPSKGLSIISSRWWGGAEPDKTLEMSRSSDNSSAGGCKTRVSHFVDSNLRRRGKSFAHGMNNEVNEVLESCRKVNRSRRRAAALGKKALQLGVAKGYGIQKLGHQQAAILQFVFGDALPRQWLAARPRSG